MPGDHSRQYSGPKDGRVPAYMERDNEKCFQCRGDGYYWRVPGGFNPFYAGAIMTAQVSERVRCWRCQGTGQLGR